MVTTCMLFDITQHPKVSSRGRPYNFISSTIKLKKCDSNLAWITCINMWESTLSLDKTNFRGSFSCLTPGPTFCSFPPRAPCLSDKQKYKLVNNVQIASKAPICHKQMNQCRKPTSPQNIHLQLNSTKLKKTPICIFLMSRAMYTSDQ